VRFLILIFLIISVDTTSNHVYRGKKDSIASFWRTKLLNNNISFPPQDIYLRAFKNERILEVWAKSTSGKFKKIWEVKFCTSSGELGPKNYEGDKQIPEGLYHLNKLNYYSRYYLSLGVDYPNDADRKRLFSSSVSLGGAIFVHGGCESIGCISIEDENIEKLFWLHESKIERTKTSLHIFPFEMKDTLIKKHSMEDHCSWFLSCLLNLGEKKQNVFLKKFWFSLKPFYDYFNDNKTLPSFRSDSSGFYKINN